MNTKGLNTMESQWRIPSDGNSLTFDSRDKNSTVTYDALERNHGEIRDADCGNVTGYCKSKICNKSRTLGFVIRAGAGCRFNGSNVVVVSLDTL